MYYYNMQIALQEVPGQISICFSICGCQLKCQGCHSPFLWKEKNGEKLTQNIYLDILNRYKGLASCVLFMGGEWHAQKLSKYLNIAQKQGYKTCLYTGETTVPKHILDELTWLKTGKWIPELGGLDSKKTNQKFIEVQSNKVLNHLFINPQNL
ncbi:anaerobic ribonucleoside-triphosphate reductase activating protein [Pseudotamlana agarivorans]|uniref:anaerobic ribonucleoside-triphosphate reductase activating protein n=1 Tax=Pseudotamlana agarivorans TaxID=481183 RepID=UPI00083330A1|nr:anaerobic ribonucleoside-triphosphate reductase activating protein [Tamlana agarivorans]